MGFLGDAWNTITGVADTFDPVAQLTGIGLGDTAQYANPYTAAQSILPDEINGTLWPQGNVLDGLGLGGGGSGKTPTAAQLTPEQQAMIAGSFSNPSTQAPITGYTQGPPQGTLGIPLFDDAAQFTGPTQVPVYGPSVRDQAMAGFQSGPRAAPQAGIWSMAQPNNVLGAQIDTSYMQPGRDTAAQGQATSQLGKVAAYQGIGNARDTRAQQQTQTQRLTDAADGRVPSVAEQQLRSGLVQGMQNNLAMAASNRGSGSSSVLAQRQAQNANTALGARTNAQAAQLRAGEMAQARQELTGQLGQVRGQDLQTGGLGAQIMGVGTQQMGVGTQQMGIGAQLGTAQAGLTQQANLANQQAALATGQANLSAAQQTSLANLNAQMTQQGMDDAQKAMYLGAILGIDARTQQGQMQLQQMLLDFRARTDATNAGIGAANATNATNQQNGLLAAGATIIPAVI